MRQWYETLFENYAKTYDQESFTKGTLGEVDFIEKELDADKTLRILDVGCGTGRHAIELAKRGYSVTGVDLSESQLNRAKEKAAAANVQIDFQKADARELTFQTEFDAVLIICEGAFSLMETDAMNFKILENVTRALKPGGKFILTTLSALYPLYHSVKDMINAEDNNMKYEKYSFDLMTFRERTTMTITDDSGTQKTFETNERFYTPSEIRWMLEQLKFQNIAIHGCKIGAFSREDTLTTEDFEMLVIAEKQ
ncbi:class I SAM-dependent methyltransferase [candidate division KSB1 bacterium]|nr:class I SAM-dependent methyltransferase [candidate division KSB1 bacterium]